jgi:UDP-N-acetylmuramate: L-alanyl-gamma-D-glutamyl-meso-diaminopimelate ligase
MPDLPKEKIYIGFGKNGLSVLNSKDELEQWLLQQSYENACLLLMSSGNFDGADILTFAKK